MLKRAFLSLLVSQLLWGGGEGGRVALRPLWQLAPWRSETCLVLFWSLAKALLPCVMLKSSARQDYLHYLKEETKSPQNSSSKSLQIRNTNYIHFFQEWTYLLTALGTKDYTNNQDVGLNVAGTVLFWLKFLITRYLINCIHIFNYILYYGVFIVFLLYVYIY